ncbi:hypothetical protein QBC47DRAFT_444918 [Echria macrotheca]|uniref:AA1-like domain-containing protein n=1 Tax=Echria macrotheca TaxID=438768 RepID=A0AAJ0FCR0_9PEZI|nr:hypothetical protein QBC47DRAFT_444918 [Echria macrotheca]
MISSAKILLFFLALLGPAASQSPGPDYPNCASVSRGAGGGPWGWELLQFTYNPIMRGRSDAREAKLFVDVQNLADGSRTVCRLSGSGLNSAGSVVLNNTSPKTAGSCETYWVSRTADLGSAAATAGGGGTKKKAPAAVASVSYDTEESVLTVNQTWTCREGGQVTTFTGTTSERLDIQCYDGSSTSRTSCGQASTPESLSYSKIAMVFLLGSSTTLPSSSSPSPSSSPINCASPKPTWQILSMLFTPPGPWPRSSAYWPTSLQLELRSLVDGSRTKCTLGQDDGTTYSESAEVLLNNTGGERLTAPVEFPNRLRGCETGVFLVPSTASSSSGGGGGEKKSTKPQWKGTEVAEVSFDTKTRVFGLNQTWTCGADRIVGSVVQTLKMDCVDSGDRYAPRQCEPKGAVFSASGAPVLLGPGTAGLESDE